TAATLLPLIPKRRTRKRIALALSALLFVAGGSAAYRWIDPYPFFPTWFLLQRQGSLTSRSTLELGRRFQNKSLSPAQVKQFYQNAVYPKPFRLLAYNPRRLRLPKGHRWTFERILVPGCELPSMPKSGGDISDLSYSATIDGRNLWV